ncbi:MAG: hypothetical protein FDX18_11590 [Chlorobium sp.]|nr:MAG: hypothetical protein FDX18_11590 [Chlorobium sp.]
MVTREIQCASSRHSTGRKLAGVVTGRGRELSVGRELAGNVEPQLDNSIAEKGLLKLFCPSLTAFSAFRWSF